MSVEKTDLVSSREKNGINLSGAIERVLIGGDLSKLSEAEKINYYLTVCKSLGLNPLTKPFSYIRLQGKEVLYANRDCTDQLRKIHGISIPDLVPELIGDVFVVRAKAIDSIGRIDHGTGAVYVANLSGDPLANAYMKAETKAKRRVTLSICGLGMLDETEVETIPAHEAQKSEEPSVEKTRIPKAVSAHRSDQSEVELCDCGKQMMISKYDESVWYCSTCKVKRPRAVGDA